MKVMDPSVEGGEVRLQYEELREKFETDMKSLMPLNYCFSCLPMKFLFIEKS